MFLKTGEEVFMKKKVFLLIGLFLCVPLITFAANGQPFQDLQNQIDVLQDQVDMLQKPVEDYCIHGVSSIDVTYVGKQFKIPAAGKCETWSGFCRSGCSPDNVQTGTACTASDGSHVSFVITTAYLASNRQWDWIRLDLPAQTGSGNTNNLQVGIGDTISYSASAGTCSPATVPVP
jgi:hypothetical protein